MRLRVGLIVNLAFVLLCTPLIAQAGARDAVLGAAQQCASERIKLLGLNKQDKEAGADLLGAAYITLSLAISNKTRDTQAIEAMKAHGNTDPSDFAYAGYLQGKNSSEAQIKACQDAIRELVHLGAPVESMLYRIAMNAELDSLEFVLGLGGSPNRRAPKNASTMSPVSYGERALHALARGYVPNDAIETHKAFAKRLIQSMDIPKLDKEGAPVLAHVLADEGAFESRISDTWGDILLNMVLDAGADPKRCWNTYSGKVCPIDLYTSNSTETLKRLAGK